MWKKEEQPLRQNPGLTRTTREQADNTVTTQSAAWCIFNLLYFFKVFIQFVCAVRDYLVHLELCGSPPYTVIGGFYFCLCKSSNNAI